MKRIIIAFIIGLASVASAAWAGEKEELRLQQVLLQERMGRLQAEFTVAQIQAKEVDGQLKAFEVKSKTQAESPSKQ